MHRLMKAALTIGLPVCVLLVAGCGGGETTENNTVAVQAHIDANTCDTIRAEVIRVAATNGVNIVKVYDPKTIKSTPTKAVCSGRALVSSGQEAKIYYRNYQDADGDWLVDYSDNRLD